MRTLSLAKLVKPEMSKIAFYQFLIIISLVAVLFLLKGFPSGKYAFAGAMTYWLPTVAFIYVVSAQAGVAVGARFLIIFIVGEGLKLFICGVIFVMLINYFHVQLLDALIGLVGAIVAFWVASAAVLLKTEAKKS